MDVPLVAYNRGDLGPRSLWAPEGRLPYGMNAQENGLRIICHLTGKVVGYRCFGVQGDDDPAPGAYLSTTSLTGRRYTLADPRRYIDSAALPGWVLPGHDMEGIARTGDPRPGELPGAQHLVPGGSALGTRGATASNCPFSPATSSALTTMLSGADASPGSGC